MPQMKATHICETQRLDRPGQTGSVFLYMHKGYWVHSIPGTSYRARFDTETGLRAPYAGTRAAGETSDGEYLVLHTLTSLPEGWQVGMSLPEAFMSKRSANRVPA